jgi:hypothetical protein
LGLWLVPLPFLQALLEHFVHSLMDCILDLSMTGCIKIVLVGFIKAGVYLSRGRID